MNRSMKGNITSLEQMVEGGKLVYDFDTTSVKRKGVNYEKTRIGRVLKEYSDCFEELLLNREDSHLWLRCSILLMKLNNLLRLLRDLIKRCSLHIRGLGGAILLFAVFCVLPASCAFCMPGAGAGDIVNVNLGAVDLYRPIINRLHEESPWAYAFDHFEELKSVIQTCHTGRLLDPDSMYDLIQQLHSDQLTSLLNSLRGSFRYNAPPQVDRQFLILAGELLQESANFMGGLESMAARIATTIGIDISHQFVGDSLPALLRGLNLLPDLERFYANELFLGTSVLYVKYTELFPYLNFV